MQIEIDHRYYEIVSWDRDYIQITGSGAPYQVFAPPYQDIDSLRQYIRLHPPKHKDEDIPYFYLDAPYQLFRKSYFVKVYHGQSKTNVQLKSSSICIYQRKNADTYKLLRKWSEEQLYQEISKRVAFWEEQLDCYAITAIHISRMSKRHYKIVGTELYFSNCLMDADSGQLNLIILKAFCKFSKKTKGETEAILNLYIPNWKTLILC